jgi:hypothetical protein
VYEEFPAANATELSLNALYQGTTSQIAEKMPSTPVLSAEADSEPEIKCLERWPEGQLYLTPPGARVSQQLVQTCHNFLYRSELQPLRDPFGG